MKRKDSVALFEVIARTREKSGKPDMDVPGWMGGQQPAAEPDQAPAPEATGPLKVPPLQPPTEPVFRPIPQRVSFSMSYVRFGGLLAGMIVLLAAAFVLGRVTAGPGTVEPTGEQPGPTARAGIDDTSPTGPPKPAGRISGKHYLIIERLKDKTPASLAEAKKIVSFLEQNGHYADIQPLRARGGGREYWGIWSLQPFDQAAGPENEAFAMKIEELGRKYPGDYRFQQRVRRDAKLEPTFIQHR